MVLLLYCKLLQIELQPYWKFHNNHNNNNMYITIFPYIMQYVTEIIIMLIYQVQLITYVPN